LADSIYSLRARVGAYAQHAKHDVRETTKAARKAFNERWAREVDPDGILPEAERERRAEAARRQYFAALALKSAKSRRDRARKRHGLKSDLQEAS
jgi:hypothetical protein